MPLITSTLISQFLAEDSQSLKNVRSKLTDLKVRYERKVMSMV
ncbi:hypothetical protein [Enterobacter sp.]|nr:hypothetical protein [Enterobacter sp.]